MRSKPWLLVPLIALAGCVAQPGPYAAPGYAQPYPAGPYDQAYPGYDYTSGAPTYIEGGVPVPLILFGGEWGHYDRERRWRRAPEPVHRHLEERRAGGGFRPYERQGEPQRFAPPGPPREQQRFVPAAAPREQHRFEPAAAPRQAGPPPARHEERERRRECPNGQPRC
jgi:hypothetical protein